MPKQKRNSQSKSVLVWRDRQQTGLAPPQLALQTLAASWELCCPPGAQKSFHICRNGTQKFHRIDHGHPTILGGPHERSSAPLQHPRQAAIHWLRQPTEPWKTSYRGTVTPKRSICSYKCRQMSSLDPWKRRHPWNEKKYIAQALEH